jgi:hypothetical protein
MIISPPGGRWRVRFMTPFRDWWCLRVVRVVPAYDIDEDDELPLDSDPELDRRDSRTTVVLGEPLSGGEFDLQDQPEPPLDDDALTVVLCSGGRARRPVWLRAPRFAAIALLVLGAGVSIRVFRRQSGESHLRGGIARHRIAETGIRAAQKIGPISTPLRPRSALSRHEVRRSQRRGRPHLDAAGSDCLEHKHRSAPRSANVTGAGKRGRERWWYASYR